MLALLLPFAVAVLLLMPLAYCASWQKIVLFDGVRLNRGFFKHG